MTGESDLTTLLARMSPALKPGAFVFVTGQVPAGVTVHASVVEAEGMSSVIEQADADRFGLDYSFIAGWITLTVHSSLSAIGLTAAVAAALTAEGISCNVIAGYFHDHLLVPAIDAEKAMNSLSRLAASHRVV